MYLQVYALKDGMRKGKIRILIGRADSATLEEAGVHGMVDTL